MPSPPAVVAPEEPARLGARVDGAGGGARREREDARLGQGAVGPRSTGVRRTPDPAFAQPRVGGVGVLGIDGETLRSRAAEEELDRPAVARLVEARDSVPRGGVQA